MGNVSNEERLKKACILSQLESELVSSLFADLEKSITLLKFAELKANGEDGEVTGGCRRRKVSNVSGRSSLSFNLSPENEVVNANSAHANSNEIANEGAALEVKKEYWKLRNEFSTIQSKRKDQAKNASSLEPSMSRSEQNLQFSKNVDYMLDVLKKTRHSLQESNNFSIFIDEVDKKLEELNQESELQSDITNVKREISKLKDHIAEIKEAAHLDEKASLCKISRLNDTHFFLQSDGKDNLKMAKFYFEAQSSISETAHRDEAAVYSKQISEANWKTDRDVHCLATMEAWTDDFCEKLEKEIDEWKLKLRKDEMLMDMRIDAKRRHIKEQEELMKSLNEIIAQRQEELAPWEKEKEIEKQERLAHMRRYYSARKLQRWWRGYMIKLKLYRRRKTKARA